MQSLSLLCHFNQALDQLKLTRDESKDNLANIEHAILLNHIDSLQELSPPQIINIVLAFGYHSMQSELLYLLEPHILKQLRDFKTMQLSRVCSTYLQVGQGSDFMKHAITAVALRADELDVHHTVTLFNRMRGRIADGAFVREIAIILENSLIPQVDELKEHQIVKVMRLLSAT